MVARIYRPAKTAMQSGTAKTGHWLLEFEPERPQWRESLMGWMASAETERQVSLRFETLEDALAYARERGIAFQVEQPPRQQRSRQSYADNFKPGRPVPWTH